MVSPSIFFVCEATKFGNSVKVDYFKEFFGWRVYLVVMHNTINRINNLFIHSLNYMEYILSRDDLIVTIILHHDTIRKITLAQARQSAEKVESVVDLLCDINAYLSGERIDFSRYAVDLSNLTDFQKRVLDKVRQIPHGMTVTYGMLARDLQTSPRAVGNALSKNPAPIVIPCHRVIGKRGIGGFTSGVTIKKHLLQLELSDEKLSTCMVL